MHDPPSNAIAAFYERAIADARAHLEKQFPVEDPPEDDADGIHVASLNPHALVWRVTVPGGKRSFSLLVAVPPWFPDRLPRLYLREDDLAELGDLPHVDAKREVCTRDAQIVVVSDSKPGEALEELLRIAVGNLEDGLNGELEEDYRQEFLAYWNGIAQQEFLAYWNGIAKPRNMLLVSEEDYQQEFLAAWNGIAKRRSMLLVSDVPPPLTKLWRYELTDSIFGASYVTGLSKPEILAWLKRLGFERTLHNGTEVLFLPVPRTPQRVLKTNSDVVKFLGDLDPDTRRAARGFCGRAILAGVRRNGEQMLFAWEHPMAMVRGFRLGSPRVSLRLLMAASRDASITSFQVKRLDRNRLVRRAVDMGAIPHDVALALVGCGSVGSSLAMLLAKSGCRRFVLVDEEALAEENAPRHLCGCHDAATARSKVDAVADALQRHLPYVSCEVHNRDLLDILAHEPEFFNTVALVILATASMGPDRRANDSFVLEKAKPAIYVWLEPYAVAGHILFVSPNKGACYRCCFAANGAFTFQVAASEQDFNRQEGGCQQTYTPYGAADLAIFCGIACKEILRLLESTPERSVLVTWIGDREAFEDLGHRINDAYAAHPPYSVHRRDICQQPSCPTCARRE